MPASGRRRPARRSLLVGLHLHLHLLLPCGWLLTHRTHSLRVLDLFSSLPHLCTLTTTTSRPVTGTLRARSPSSCLQFPPPPSHSLISPFSPLSNASSIRQSPPLSDNINTLIPLGFRFRSVRKLFPRESNQTVLFVAFACSLDYPLLIPVVLLVISRCV